MNFLLGLLKSPITWAIILTASVALYFHNITIDNMKLKTQVQDQSQIIAAQQESIRIQQSDMQIIKDLNAKKQTIVIQQKAVNDKLSQIPDTSKNHPFTNSDLLNAAGVVRDSQQVQPTTKTPSDHR